MDEEIRIHLEQVRRDHEERVFFLQQGLGADIHWFFCQALEALKSGLYLPACTSFLIGIEASLRVTLAQIDKPARVDELDPAKLLSNRLLLNAQQNGLPVQLLSFPNENDFIEKLSTKKPNLVNVELVRVRHNLCHGNILGYIDTELGEHNAFFTPECCRELAITLYGISRAWTKGLGQFRGEMFNA
ncbi:hypothetical protein [Stutzerimonas stutzeri]|uniref:hypothetical protein n=1 Tax=Stutzerimonas stutzeri TaxID=316 RepID=UPI0017856D8E|nr:hypothetical protein [Stutzerimonas stutzeri]MBD9412202.1 hypothetical protein [Stutzerimonas stutzeri]